MPPRRRFALALALAVSAALAGSALASGQPGKATPKLALRELGRFELPVYVTQAPGEPRTVYVVEQAGRVMAIRNGGEPRPFLDITDRVSFGPAEADSYEAGMYSIAFHPGYEKNGRFYAFYNGNSGNNQIVGYRRSGAEGRRADRRSAQTVLTIPHPYSDTHNGGQIEFGPDGLLYIGTGDGACCGDDLDQARSLESLLGKLLRVQPRAGKPGYLPAASNPLIDVPGHDAIYAWGLRNPWRFAFDRLTGDLVIADVGDEGPGEEEIDMLSLASARGANFGWPQYEGFSVNDPNRPGEGAPVFPIHSYRQTAENDTCAITGGYVVRDRALPSLWGRYLYADFCRGKIRSLLPPAVPPDGPPSELATDDRSEGLDLHFPSSFGEGLHGQIYVASRAGPVYRLESADAGRGR